MHSALLTHRNALIELLQHAAALIPASDEQSPIPPNEIGLRAKALLADIEREEAQHCHYTCEGKGGRYELLGSAKGAGTSRGQLRTVYRSTETGELFFREPGDFASRMAPIDAEGMGAPPSASDQPPTLAQGFYQPRPEENSYSFLDNADDPGDCEGSVPAVIIARSELDRLQLREPISSAVLAELIAAAKELRGHVGFMWFRGHESVVCDAPRSTYARFALAVDALREAVPVHPDDEAVDRFAAAMKAKLEKARAKGRGGWEDVDGCSDELIAGLLIGHLGKGNAGNLEDIANFAMMLYCRGADPQVLADVACRAGLLQQRTSEPEASN
jgi:hypothetical protein